jgi:hypothetical protein
MRAGIVVNVCQADRRRLEAIVSDRSSPQKHAHHLGAPLDLAVEAFDRIGAVQLGAVLGRKGHVGQDVGFGIVQEGGELAQLGA